MQDLTPAFNLRAVFLRSRKLTVKKRKKFCRQQGLAIVVHVRIFPGMRFAPSGLRLLRDSCGHAFLDGLPRSRGDLASERVLEQLHKYRPLVARHVSSEYLPTNHAQNLGPSDSSGSASLGVLGSRRKLTTRFAPDGAEKAVYGSVSNKLRRALTDRTIV